jgi:hypothetical protein
MLSNSHAFMPNNHFITLVDLTFLVLGITSFVWGTKGINKRLKAKNTLRLEGQMA